MHSATSAESAGRQNKVQSRNESSARQHVLSNRSLASSILQPFRKSEATMHRQRTRLQRRWLVASLASRYPRARSSARPQNTRSKSVALTAADRESHPPGPVPNPGSAAHAEADREAPSQPHKARPRSAPQRSPPRKSASRSISPARTPSGSQSASPARSDPPTRCLKRAQPCLRVRHRPFP